MKFGQLIMKSGHVPVLRNTPNKKLTPRQVGSYRRRQGSGFSSSISAEVAAERVGFLHQAFAGDDFDDVVIVLLVLHVLFHLALHDDDRTDALVILGTI